MGRSRGAHPYWRRLFPCRGWMAWGAKEIERTHLDPVPERTCVSDAGTAAADLLPWFRLSRLLCETVRFARDPHLVQHDGKLACKGHLGLAQSTAGCKADSP